METLLLAGGVPRGLGKVEVSAVLSFKTRRRRDAVNYRTLLEKSLGDALVNGGWLDDDTGAEFVFGAIVFEVGDPQTELLLVTPGGCNAQDGTSPPTRPTRAAPRG